MKKEKQQKHTSNSYSRKEKQSVRYTAMMPDIPFLVFGLLSDMGWIIHLAAGITYFCRNGFHYVLDYIALIALAAVIFGVAYIIFLNKIHEKEIATRTQKNLGFGVTVYAGLAGAVIGIFQIVTYAGVSSEIVWIIIGGFLNFVSGLPIYLSFKATPHKARLTALH